MATTAFGFSSFGTSAFGQSVADSTITIECSEEVYQVAIWYIEGTTNKMEYFDINSDFGITPQGPTGNVSQVGNVVVVSILRDCFIVAVHLFDTNEDISYLSSIPFWDVPSLYPRIGGSLRISPTAGLSVAASPYQDAHTMSITGMTDDFYVEEDAPVRNLMSTAKSESGRKLNIIVDYKEVE